MFAIVGFLVGAIFGVSVLQFARGGRSLAYRDFVKRHPSLRLLSGLCVIACGVVVAILAHGPADGAELSSRDAKEKAPPVTGGLSLRR